MASIIGTLSIKNFAFRFTFILLFLNAIAAVPGRELDSMLAALRTRGYSLFCNAIVTTDLYYEVLSGASFTFFAPTDSSLFALDMSATALDYVNSLRYHVVPRRLDLGDLRSLPSGSTLRTLMPRHEIRIERRPLSDILAADGIELVVPGLFYGRDIAVHGLGGILNFRSQIGLHHKYPPPQVSFHLHPPPPPAGYNQSPRWNYTVSHGLPDVDGHHAPPPDNNPSTDGGAESRRVASPVTKSATFNQFPPVQSPEQAGSPVETWPANALLPESSAVPNLAPDREPPAPSMPKDADSATPPWIGNTRARVESPSTELSGFPSLEGGELSLVGGPEPKSEVYSNSPPMVLPPAEEAVDGITDAMTEILRPFDQEIIDCQVNEGVSSLGHGIQSGYVAQQYYSSAPTCGRTKPAKFT
ncbi:hypothetical protein NMG60_11021508 [Bertholletia excelsa]